MKIGLDLRFINNSLYSQFIISLISKTIRLDNQNQYIIYTNKKIDALIQYNDNIREVNIPNGSWQEQTQYYKILQQESYDLVIFFTYHKPLLYSRDYYIFMPSLKDIYYHNFANIFKKYLYIFHLEKSIAKAQKIIVLDQNTKNELTERFNIAERKISILPAFFLNIQDLPQKNIPLDIKSKYSIENDFFIYSGGNGIEKNYEKLIYSIDRLKQQGIQVDLVVLWHEIAKNIPLRNLCIALWIQKNIHFLWEISHWEEYILYSQAIAALLPSLYETFPFCLSKAIEYNTPIIASNLNSIKTIFWENIAYYSPISINNITKSLQNFIISHKKVNYNDVLSQYNPQLSSQTFINIIN